MPPMKTTVEIVAIANVDGLRVFNEDFSHSAGDALLRRLADIFASVGLNAEHQEARDGMIRFKGESYQELDTKLSQARHIFRQPFELYADGRNQTIEGTSFSFGIGATFEEASHALKRQKETQP
jgi:GGDEF domain-containing protein